FGNGNNAPPTLISLAGTKLSFNPNTDILTINLGAAGLTLSSAEYRIILLGVGSNVIKNSQGLPLDGLNTSDGTANGSQLALPSGADNIPGSNFYLTFIVDTSKSSIVPGTFFLSPSADSNKRDGITNTEPLTFQGTITDPNTALEPLGGQTV